jgi:hypothetical protein
MKHLYIIYCITNKINNKFYIGIHKTLDVNDEYMGSGRYITAAINKHGLKNFTKKILHVFTNKIEAFAKEKELVCKSLLESNLSYNIKEGGHGGFDHIRAKGLNNSCLGRKHMYSPITNKNSFVKKENIDSQLKAGWLFGHSPSARLKMSLSGKKKIQSQLHRKKNSDSKKNSLLMINSSTKIKKFVKKAEINAYENNGWTIYDWKFLKIKQVT